MNFAETVVPILLDQQRNLVFNANTMKAYENVTGKFYLDTVAKLYDAMRPSLEVQRTTEMRESLAAVVSEVTGEPVKAVTVSALDVIHSVPMNDLLPLIWAALHEYGKNPVDPDEPSWPLTLNRVGRLIQFADVPRVFTAFLKGQIKNSPTESEMGESLAPSVTAVKVNGHGAAPTTEADNGGERSINLPADAFA